MKKIILSIAMLVIASCAFAADAEYLIKQYKKVSGAKYENITKRMKKEAKKQKYTNPKEYELSQRIKKAHLVMVNLSAEQREVLTKNISEVDNYKCLYQKKSNTENMLSKEFSLFLNREYYGIEEDGVIKDAIIRVDAHKGGAIETIIFHANGEMTIEELMGIMQLNETKNINIK